MINEKHTLTKRSMMAIISAFTHTFIEHKTNKIMSDEELSELKLYVIGMIDELLDYAKKNESKNEK